MLQSRLFNPPAPHKAFTEQADALDVSLHVDALVAIFRCVALTFVFRLPNPLTYVNFYLRFGPSTSTPLLLWILPCF